MTKISVVINTLNEEKNLPRALASVKGFADEVVVVDMHSDDKTFDVAKKCGAKVYKHKREGYVEPARNFAIGKATGEWIFILDADEELPVSLARYLKRPTTINEADYYRIARKNIIFGKWMKHSRWWPDMNIRFFKKGYVSWSEVIHSVPTTTGKGADLKVNEDLAIIHHHYETLEQYIDKLNRYTTHHAKNEIKEGYKFTWTDLVNKPSGEFLSRYFQAEGYKDGLHGLALAGLQGFSEFVKYLKIWQLDKFQTKPIDVSDVVEKMKGAESDVHYWQADTMLKEVGGIKHKIKRKFKLP
jgi:(heptosyl)LPS beta-1,4-glucosyltransferase